MTSGVNGTNSARHHAHMPAPAMSGAELVRRLKEQGLTNRDIIDLFKEHGREGLEELAS